MNFIEHICEPEKLLLCWQAPSDGTRYVVVELYRSSANEYIFKYLKNTNDFKDAQKLGFTMHPAFHNNQDIHNSGVLEAFTGRIPPRSRNDFKEYLQNFRISNNVSISDFALLGYTGAKLPSDGFSIINPFENTSIPSEFLIELAGTRHMKGLDLKTVQIGDPVEFIEEPNNQYDKEAIFVVSKGQKLGYISRWQTQAFHKWIRDRGISLLANVERINGTNERPVIYVFLRLLAK